MGKSLYGKITLWENHCHKEMPQKNEHQEYNYGAAAATAFHRPPPPSAASIIANRRCCCQWIFQQLAMLRQPPTQWGEGLSILLVAGSSYKEAFVWEGRRAGTRWSLVDDLSLPPSRQATYIPHRFRCHSRVHLLGYSSCQCNGL